MAIDAIRQNKLRSILTLLGISIGVFSVIGVMTAIRTLESSVESGLNVFAANTFNPDSTDDSNVLIAVMTPITEKTPILIPNKVNEDRSLFFLIESVAIQKLSFNMFFRFLDCIFYSYLSESMGSNFAAR